MGTRFAEVYNRFLGKITDDMYMELTPEDTVKDLRNLLLEAISGFEFPRKDLMQYEILEYAKLKTGLEDEDFVIREVESDDEEDEETVIIECSNFQAELTTEEINILAILMMIAWVQRQTTSIEHTRMKYTGTDFKMSSQANHLAKLMNLLSECQRQSHHLQRLYKRRRFTDDGFYRSNWDTFKYDQFN